MPMMMRRRLLAASLGCAPMIGLADERYPSRPITVVMPGTVGGSPDVMARLLSLKLQGSLGQSLVVDTQPGGSGVIGIQKMLRAPADGYTLLYGYNQLVTINPHLLKEMPYDVERDLAPVSMTADLAYVWIANNDFPPSTMAEWIAYMKANPNKVNFGTAGPGSAAHLGGEMLMKLTGTQMIAVGYKSSSTPDLLSGVIQIKMEPYTTAVPLVQAGRVKALAVTGAKRVPVLAQVPTVTETLPGYVIRGWQAVWVRKGTPAPIIERLNREFALVLKDPEVAERMTANGLQPSPSSARELQQLIRTESKVWGELIRERGIQTN